jgi:hypothetical protein
MDADLKKTLRNNLIIAVVIASVAIGYMAYKRRDTGVPPKKVQETYSANMDDYVTPKKIFPYNVESAKKEIAGKTIWVKAGNIIPYYAYEATSHSANFKKKLGVLPPLAKLQIKDVIVQKEPVTVKEGQVSVVQKDIMAVFEIDGKTGTFAAPFGTNSGDDYNFTANDSFFFEDPHVLYKHWPADVWSSVDQHQAKVGMNELQASFALGASLNSDGTEYGNRTVEYTNAGNPVTVVFEKNKATSVTPGKAP